MALDPFQGLSAEARRRGYDPLAIMAGLGVGQQRAAEMATERQRRQAEAEQQAGQLQLQARQMTMQQEQAQRQLAESQAQRAIEMERLGMTRLQQEQEAALQGRRLDQEMLAMQRREAEAEAERQNRLQQLGLTQQGALQLEGLRQASLQQQAREAEARLLGQEKRATAAEIAKEQRAEARSKAQPSREALQIIYANKETTDEMGNKVSTPPSAEERIARARELQLLGYNIPDSFFQSLAAGQGQKKTALQSLRERLNRSPQQAPTQPATRTPVERGRAAARIQNAIGVPTSSSVFVNPVRPAITGSVAVRPLAEPDVAARQALAAKQAQDLVNYLGIGLYQP